MIQDIALRQKPLAATAMANPMTKVVSLTSFKGTQKDSFDATQIKVLKGKLSPELREAVKAIENGKGASNYIAAGADGAVYKIASKEYPLGVAVKVSHTDPVNAAGQMQRIGVKFEDELGILEALPKSLTNTQKLVAYLKTGEDKYYLLSTFVKGKNPDPINNPFTHQHLETLLDSLYQLDATGILHRDLKKDNILFEQNAPANLIDYGVSVKFNQLDPEGNKKDHNFPVFSVPTNLRNFEDTCLFPYLQKLSDSSDSGKQQAREVFVDYLKLRANFHQKKAEFLKQQLGANKANLQADQIAALKKAIKYEAAQAKTFAILNNVTPANRELADDIVNLEAMKIQVTYAAEEAYRNEVLEKNPIANVAWKTYSGISARRLGEQVEALKEKYAASGNKDLNNLLELHKEYAEFKANENLHPWTQGAFNWIWDNILRKHDGQDYSKDMISQLSNDKILTRPLALHNVADKIAQAKTIRETSNVA